MCQRPQCCSSVVATGVARMGGAKALLGSARGVGRDSVCVRASLCVSESMCVLLCVCVCVSERASVIVRIRGPYAAAVQWLRVSPVWEVPKSYTARRGVWADSVSECVRVCVREVQSLCVCVCVSVRVRFRERASVCL